MSTSHWSGCSTQVLQSDRQTRAPDFPDDRPGGQAISHSGLEGFSHFVFVTNRRWW